MTEPEPMHRRIAAAFEGAAFPGVLAAFLFGSHGRGSAHRESDVDVGILLDRRRFPERRARFAERVRLTAWLIGEIHVNEVDVVILNDAAPLLARHIVTEGTRILCVDAPAMHDFYRDTLLRAAEIEPFLRRMARIKLPALAR